MNKSFNRVQTLKSSEDCYKFSKSVSYETLVGGTATTGRDIKQTRRLSEGSTDKPLTAVGTLTSLLCNSAKVVEKWLQMSPIFRLVKIVSLVAVLSLNMVNESLAEIKNYKCGENCTATLDENGIFTISGSGEMTNFGYNCEIEGKTKVCDSKGNIRPWENELNDIKTIKFAEDSEIISIGSKSFILAKNLTEASFSNSLESIDQKGLKYAPLSTIILPDTLKSIGNEVFAGTGSLDSINIICMGNEDTCADMKNVLSKYCNANCGKENAQIVDLSGKVSYANSEQCNSQKYYYGDNGCTRLPTQKSDCLSTQYYYWNGKKCSKFGADENINCASGFVEWENACLDEYPFAKKRWTPAEADEWLHDGNDNFVIITFKK